MIKGTVTELKKYFSGFPTVKFAKGTEIHRPGSKLKFVYFTRSGFVRLFTKNGNQETTLNIFRPLFTLSLMHAYSNRPCNFYIEAITDCELWQVPKEEALKYFHKDTKLSQQVMSYFTGSIMEFFNNQANLLVGNATNKVAAILLQLAFDYGTLKHNTITVPFPATHRIIATLIGLTRETTSVQMSKLQKQGIISTKRSGFTILNLDKLKQLSQELS